MALIKSSPGQQWPGFSFALHLLRVQGFCFALLQYSPIQTFTAAFVSSMQLYHPRNKTAHRALQALFLLFAPFYRHRYQPPRRTLYRSAQTAYYNKVYKGAAPVIGPRQTVQHIADHASPAACSLAPGQQSTRAGTLAPYTRRGSPAAGARRAARNH